MPAVALVTLVVAGVVALTPVADRLRIPQPVLLTMFGFTLGILPFVAPLHVNPEYILPAVLPPLLFAATQRTTAREFQREALSVALLAVGLTVASAAAVAVVGHLAGLSWTAAWVLGAIVSPPDPVAATAVARRLRLPERLVTILEGEGMFNDATALVLYRVAVAAAVTGAFSIIDAGLELLLAVAVGVLVGLGLGWVAKVALAALHDAYPETTVTLFLPFVAYLGAEELHGSGVLAVLVLGLFLRSFGDPSLTSSGWLLGRSVWGYVDFIVTGLTFVLLGDGIVQFVRSSDTDLTTLRTAGLVIGALIVLRFAWVFPAAALVRFVRARREESVPLGWRETTVTAWAGMRGVVTVATALALPVAVDSGERFPDREEVVLIGLLCVVVTLVIQGLTLSPLVRRLGVGVPGDEEHELARLRDAASSAALAALKAPGDSDHPQVRALCEGVDGRALEAAQRYYEAVIRARDELRPRGGGDVPEDMDGQLARLVRAGLAVERDLVAGARRRGEVSPATADELLREIENRAIRTPG